MENCSNIIHDILNNQAFFPEEKNVYILKKGGIKLVLESKE